MARRSLRTKKRGGDGAIVPVEMTPETKAVVDAVKTIMDAYAIVTTKSNADAAAQLGDKGQDDVWQAMYVLASVEVTDDALGRIENEFRTRGDIGKLLQDQEGGGDVEEVDASGNPIQKLEKLNKKRNILLGLLGFIVAMVFLAFSGVEVMRAEGALAEAQQGAEVMLQTSCPNAFKVAPQSRTTLTGMIDPTSQTALMQYNTQDAICTLAKGNAATTVKAAVDTAEKAWSSLRTKLAAFVTVALVMLGRTPQFASAILAVLSMIFVGSAVSTEQVGLVAGGLSSLKLEGQAELEAEVAALKAKKATELEAKAAAAAGPAAAGTGTIAAPPAPAGTGEPSPGRYGRQKKATGGKTRAKKSKRRVTRRKARMIKFAY